MSVQPLYDDDPEQIGPYAVVGRLGSGGMGVVYLAEAPDGRLVAVKLVHAELARDPGFRERFRSEVEHARQVPPFSTAELLDADPDAPQPYLVVEYVNGPSLYQVVRGQGPLSPANLHAVAIGMATALTAIHGAGVIHRDLKPSNVLLAPGSPKVIDFGIARAMEPSGVQLTGTGQLFGTVNYMAPERFDDSTVPLTPAADIFAWGCVVTFAGTGRTPFDADSPAAVVAKIMTQSPQLDGLADGPLRRLVERALAADPAARPTARELLNLLVGDGSAAPTTPRPLQPDTGSVPSGQPRKQVRRTAAILVTAVAALVTVGTIPIIRSNVNAAASETPAAEVAVIEGVRPALPSPTAAAKSPAPTRARPASPSAAPSVKKTKKPVPKASSKSAPPRREHPVVKAADSKGTLAYGPYFIHNAKTGMCVDLPGSGPGAVEQPVQQHECATTGADNQEWTFLRNGADNDGNALYQIKNRVDGLCLDLPGQDAVSPDTSIGQAVCTVRDNQDFRLVARPESGGKRQYRLVNAASGLCLDVPGNGNGGIQSVLAVEKCAAGDDHEWELIEKSEW